MRGLPEFNYPAFHDMAAALRARGHEVYNPAEYPHDGSKEAFPIRQAFADYARFICLEADALFLLPGWECSLGASAEIALAKNCRLPILLDLADV